MESEVFARTNGYCIFCEIESSTGLVKQLVNLMGYRKRRKAIFYNGSSYKETLEDTRPYEVVSCYFPINEPVLSNTLVHGKIFNEKENIVKINRIHDILTKNCLDTNFCLDIDGDFSMAIIDKDHVLALRSPISSRPLYLSKDEKHFVVTSDPYPLDFLGIKYDCISSGSILNVRLSNGIKTDTRRYYSVVRQNKVKEGLEGAVRMLKASLDYSVQKNLEGVNRVGIAFSGGLDSSVLVKLIESSGVTPFLFTVCTKDSHDSVHAKKVADLLSLHHSIINVDEGFLEKRMLKFYKILGKGNIMNLSIALILNLVAEEAARIGLEQVVGGQGADELLGGYKRYLDTLRSQGTQLVESALRDDFEELQCSKISRDEVSISMFVEPIMPFFNKKVVETAISLPIEYKINESNGERKVVLRTLAKELGLGKEVYLHPKKAMQYSSGIQKLVSRIIRKG